MKKNIFTIALFSVFVISLFLNPVKAQTPYFIKYFNKNNAEILPSDSAYYVRYYFVDSAKYNVNELKQRPFYKDASYFNVKEFYVNKKMKSESWVWFKNGGEFLDSTYHEFNVNGKISAIVNYRFGNKLGAEYAFYPNRKIKYVLDNKQTSNHGLELYTMANQCIDFNSMMANGHLISYVDTNGVEVIKDGNGILKRTLSVFGEEIVEEGYYKEGLKDGEWTLKVVNSDKIYNEVYKTGNFIKGSVTENGKKKSYRKIVEVPRFPDYFSRAAPITIGPQKLQIPTTPISFQDYLREINFPYVPKTNDGSSVRTVFFKLVIDKNGSFKSLDAISFVKPEILLQLVNQFKKLKRFTPGYYRGKAVDMEYPNFKLLITDN